MTSLTKLETPKDTYTVDYPQAIDAAIQQQKILWFAEELGVEKDEHDIRTKCTPAERHGITTVLKLFTQYELMLGGVEFWGGKVVKMFPRPDIERMANAYSFVEINSHAPFYDLINKTIGLATDEFYSEWRNDKVLSSRISFVKKWAMSEDKLRALAAFTFMEGVVLFSSFAFLKSFNTAGHNMIPHITSGIDASAKDENLHATASSWLFRQLLLEKKEIGVISDKEIEKLYDDILEIAQQVYEHEQAICDMIFEKEGVRTVKKEEVLHFIRNRVDYMLEMLNAPKLFNEEEGVVSEWFYSQLSSYKHSDFFSNSQVQYVRTWKKHLLRFGGK